MRPSEALARYRDEIRALTLRHKAANPRVFGSAARGGDTESSDLDILVDRRSGATLIDLSALQMDLEALLGVRVEVRTSNELGTAIRDEVVTLSQPI